MLILSVLAQVGAGQPVFYLDGKPVLCGQDLEGARVVLACESQVEDAFWELSRKDGNRPRVREGGTVDFELGKKTKLSVGEEYTLYARGEQTSAFTELCWDGGQLLLATSGRVVSLLSGEIVTDTGACFQGEGGAP